MKTRYIFALSLLALVFSCGKDVEPDLVSGPDDLVTISAILPDAPATRGAGLETKLSWTWNAGDKITVIGETTEVFKIKEGFSPKKAEFVGRPVKGKTFTILYPGQDALETDWSLQTQKGNNSLAHLRYEAALENVDDYFTFAFDPAWAAEHAGTLKQTGVLKLTVEVPDGITEPASIAVSADTPLFYKGNGDEEKTDKLQLNLSDCTPEDGVLTAWFNTSWNAAEVPSGATLYVVLGGNDKLLSRDVLFSKKATLETGVVNLFTLAGGGWADEAQNAHYAGGKGTKAAPWIIETPEQLVYLAGDLAEGSIRYAKLGADIDMTGIDWVPLNNVDPFNKFIDFDGAGHTISNLTVGETSYASFAGVLYGTIKDVTFDGAKIDAGGNKTGVVAGYVGTSANLYPCSLTGVTVKNSSVTGTSSMGGVVAQVAVVTTISDCHIQNSTVTGGTTNNVGGFMGYPDAAGARIENCTVTGVTVNSPNAIQYVGGFTGNINKAAVFENCQVKDVVINASSSKRVGGFVGQAGRHEGSVITKCVVENATISGGQNSGGFVGVDYHPAISKCAVIGGTITAGNTQVGGFAGYPEGNATLKCQITDSFSTIQVEGGSRANVGGFIGIAKGLIVVTNCYAAGEVTGTDAKTGIFAGSVDVNTAAISSCIGWNASLPFAGAVKDGSADVKDNYVGAEGTLSAKAVEMGWSADVWDFSADLPKLK